jgi:hypothetical protein
MSDYRTYHCPCCDGESEKCYRCTECGKDLAGVSGESQ